MSSRDKCWCDDCGDELPDGTACVWAELPADIESANQGESAILCAECESLYGYRKLKEHHLLAAAPDLLRAVDHVLRASEDGGGMNDIDWNQLRAAIAKAKGEVVA